MYQVCIALCHPFDCDRIYKCYNWSHLTVVALFAFCWMFTHVNHLLMAFQISTFCKLPAALPLFFFWFSHVNAAINPIIYFIFNTKFREGLRKVLKGEVNNNQTRNVVIPQENFAFRFMELERNGRNIKRSKLSSIANFECEIS